MPLAEAPASSRPRAGARGRRRCPGRGLHARRKQRDPPHWCADPDATGRQQLSTLRRSWALFSCPSCCATGIPRGPGRGPCRGDGPGRRRAGDDLFAPRARHSRKAIAAARWGWSFPSPRGKPFCRRRAKRWPRASTAAEPPEASVAAVPSTAGPASVAARPRPARLRPPTFPPYTQSRADPRARRRHARPRSASRWATSSSLAPGRSSSSRSRAGDVEAFG